jgi:hypothetical protein
MIIYAGTLIELITFHFWNENGAMTKNEIQMKSEEPMRNVARMTIEEPGSRQLSLGRGWNN